MGIYSSSARLAAGFSTRLPGMLRSTPTISAFFRPLILASGHSHRARSFVVFQGQEIAGATIRLSGHGLHGAESCRKANDLAFLVFQAREADSSVDLSTTPSPIGR